MRELKQNWKDLFGGFKLAFDLWKIVLAFAGIALTVIVLYVTNTLADKLVIGIFGALVALAILYALINMLDKAARSAGKEAKPVSTKKKIVFFGLAVAIAIVTLILILATSEGTQKLVTKAIAWIFGVAIWALFGGAITRIATVEVATDDRIGLSEAFRFALKKYREYILAPVLAVAFIAFMSFLIWLGMLVSSIPWFGTVILVIIIFPLVILAGFIITLVVIGLLFGFPLMWPTVSAEGSDSFDALSRAYSYLYSRPWKYIWYNLVALLYALACLIFICLFFHFSVGVMRRAGGRTDTMQEIWPRVDGHISTMLEHAQDFGNDTVMAPLDRYVLRRLSAPGRWVSEYARGVIAAVNPKPAEVDKKNIAFHMDWATFWMSVGLCLYAALFASFAFALAFSMWSAIYFLLRKDVDGTEMTEVFIEEEEEETPESPGFDTEGESASAEDAEPEEKKEDAGEAPEESSEDTPLDDED